MNREAQARGYERMKKLKIPERFKDYRVMLADMPNHPEYDLVYDMPLKTIWINTAAQPGANVIRMETDK
jgi:hypothetical protein